MISKKSVFAIAKAVEGVAVLGALPGSPAARAGVRYGDVLLAVNGVRTRTALDYVEARALRSDGMEVVVFRAGAELALALPFAAPAAPVDHVAVVRQLIAMRVAGGDDEMADEPPAGDRLD